jgi:choline dehydrogenase-like flavoprotein
MTRAELQPYYDRACRLLEIPRFDRDYDADPLSERPPLNVGGEFFSAPRAFSPISGWADRDRFNRFRTVFAEANNINVYLHANVTHIRLHSDGRRVSSLDVACLNGHRHSAHAGHYILAAGGIENVRILLASNSVMREGVGNHSDLVGRCFQGHVTFGVFEHPDGLNSGLANTNGQSTTLYTDNARNVVHCVLGASLEGQRRHRTGNFTTTFFDGPPPDGEDGAIAALAGRLDSNGAPAGWKPCFFMSEQLPNPESRLTLQEGHFDALGMPYLHLDWVYSRADLDNLERSIAMLGNALGAASLGRARWPVERSALLSILNTSRHHMGTTRMSCEADNGVVDENARVHGVRNLYIAGSSVFPTSGIINPTLTIIALAMRLSDHLKRRLGVRA